MCYAREELRSTVIGDRAVFGLLVVATTSKDGEETCRRDDRFSKRVGGAEAVGLIHAYPVRCQAATRCVGRNSAELILPRAILRIG